MLSRSLLLLVFLFHSVFAFALVEDTSKKYQRKILIAPEIVGNHLIGLTMFSGNEEGIGFSGISYEGMLGANKGKACFSIWLPVSVSFKGFKTSGAPELFRNQELFSFTPGIKFYPAGTKKVNCYAIAIQYCYQGGKFSDEVNYNASGPYGRGDRRFIIRKTGLMLNNSINVFPRRGFYYGFDVGVGITFRNQKEFWNYKEGATNMQTLSRGLLIAVNFRMGWRV